MVFSTLDMDQLVGKSTLKLVKLPKLKVMRLKQAKSCKTYRHLYGAAPTIQCTNVCMPVYFEELYLGYFSTNHFQTWQLYQC